MAPLSSYRLPFAEWLRKHADFIAQHQDAPVAQLALSLSALPEAERSFVLQQIDGHQRMRHKQPQLCEIAGYVFPPRLSIEQASGAAAAAYKRAALQSFLARGVASESFVDLTGGMGMDFAQLAPLFLQATYVERQAPLVAMAAHNFPLLGLKARCLCAQAEDYLREMPRVDVLFLDPARRDAAGRKTVLLEDCQPDVSALLPQLLSRCTLLVLKLSTMLDLHSALAQLSCVVEAHVFAERGEAKDLLLFLRADHQGEALLVAANEGGTFSASRAAEALAPCPLLDGAIENHLGQWLYVPDAAVMKLGLFRSVAARFGLTKLHPNTHLYLSAQAHTDFPGRRFRLVEVCGFSKKELRKLIALGPAHLAVRNFPQTVAQLRERLRLAEGGEHYLFATTLNDGRKCLLRCEKPTE